VSLRTKILAAIVGLNLAALLAPVAWLVLARGRDAEPSVPSHVVSLLSRAQLLEDDPLQRARRAALRALSGSDGVEEVVWLEEVLPEGGREPRVRARPVDDGPGGEREPAPARAAALFQEARAAGRARVARGEVAVVLDAPAPPAPDPEVPVAKPSPRTYQGAYVRWTPAEAFANDLRDVYLFVLAGILLQSAVAWWLLSRLIVSPLRRLAGAADRIAAGDHAARVTPTGSGDEFDRTALAFNRMAGEVGEYQAQLEDRVLQALGRIRRAEQHLAIAQRLAATGTLASGIAHEINNPLGGMRNAAKALARGDLPPEKTSEYLELVVDGLARIEETVKKVLSFTPRGGKPRTTDLAEVARKAAALARHRAERRGVRLEERLGTSAPVFGDPHELQQVALNLVLNAVDAIPEEREPGRGRVEVAVETEDDAVVLRVSDDGRGMTPEVQAQCFDLFFTTKAVGEGTGLGLAVAHTIVTNHGGRVEVDSAPGRGTTFRVVLPKEGPPEAAEAPSREVPESVTER
jgi:signal transduction histidine kinase